MLLDGLFFEADERPERTEILVTRRDELSDKERWIKFTKGCNKSLRAVSKKQEALKVHIGQSPLNKRLYQTSNAYSDKADIKRV